MRVINGFSKGFFLPSRILEIDAVMSLLYGLDGKLQRAVFVLVLSDATDSTSIYSAQCPVSSADGLTTRGMAQPCIDVG